MKEAIDDRIQWVLFGGIASAIHNGEFYRSHGDIDIIVQNDDQKIIEVFNVFNLREGDIRFRDLEMEEKELI